MKHMEGKALWITAIVILLMVALILTSGSHSVQARSKGYSVQVPADVEWVSTGIYIDASSGPVLLSISTKGGVLTGPVNIYGGRPMGPEGSVWFCYDQPGNDFYCALDGQPWGRLIGRIGPFGEPFDIGNVNSITINTSGFLYLTINDFLGTYYDNKGEFTVLINR
ncbi:MAG: hypothetical protein LLG42_03210 [Chloroflexi bacterium]|nr:hypothetical protein [Chloroflexota bacterium]